jgi:putative acetyltransferase
VIEIRSAQPEDSNAICTIHLEAFGGPIEAKLVELITKRKKALISLVAVIDDSNVVGHVLFSRVTIENSPTAFSAVGLAPIGVLPHFQRNGIGSKLMKEGLERCRKAGYHAVVLLGDPAYYSRFGFLRAADFGLDNEYGAHDEFMVLPLCEGALNTVSGMVRYLPEFREAESSL